MIDDLGMHHRPQAGDVAAGSDSTRRQAQAAKTRELPPGRGHPWGRLLGDAGRLCLLGVELEREARLPELEVQR